MRLKKDQYRIQSKKTGLIQIIDKDAYETLYSNGRIKRYIVLPQEDIVTVKVQSTKVEEVKKEPEKEPEMKWLKDEEIDKIDKPTKPKKKSYDESK